jgi:hypothetical protein
MTVLNAVLGRRHVAALRDQLQKRHSTLAAPESPSVCESMQLKRGIGIYAIAACGKGRPQQANAIMCPSFA